MFCPPVVQLSGSHLLMLLLRSRFINKKMMIKFRFVSPPLRPSFPYGFEVIQMLKDAVSVRNGEEKKTGQMAGLWGRAGWALAGPHPVALIYIFFSSSRVSPSPLRWRSSACAVTPVILLSAPSATPSFLCISLHPLSLHHRRGCMCALVMMVRGFKPASLLPSLLPLLHFRSTPPLPPLPAHFCSSFLCVTHLQS